MAYPKEIREKCGEIFAARRNRSAEELAARRANAMAKIPELAKLERELASTSIKLSKASGSWNYHPLLKDSLPAL